MTFKDKILLSKNVALIAGVFCIVVALLLLLNYLQMSGSDPIESKVLEALVTRLKQEPNNAELMAEIRHYDLLARKAYFNSLWQIKTGAMLLLLGAVVLVTALITYFSYISKIEVPDQDQENEILSRMKARKWLVGIALILFGGALFSSVLSVNFLDAYVAESSDIQIERELVTESVEVIEVGSLDETVPEAMDEPLVQEVPVEEPAAEEPLRKGVEPEIEIKTSLVHTSAILTSESIRKQHNSFRGPLGQGVVYHRNIPVKWDGASGSNVLWKSKIPRHGFNSPVVWGDKVFISGADAQVREVYCYNAENGQLLWTGKADNIPGSPGTPPRVTEDTGLSASTVTTDGERVYAVFATGDVTAFDFSGKRVWARNLGVPDNHYGHSSSLLVWDEKVLIQYDTNKGGKVMALDSETGEPIWETTRKSKISWASPVLVQINGNSQLILTADPIVAGYDVKTGTELWAVDCMMGEVGPSVACDDGIVYAANEYARMVAIDIESGDILWEDDMYLPEAASPLAYKGLLFIATSYGVLVCYDSKNGEIQWEHDVGKTLYSSPVYADEKLYMMDNEGVMRIYEFSEKMKLIAENSLGESTATTPAFDEGKIFIRGEEYLYCIKE